MFGPAGRCLFCPLNGLLLSFLVLPSGSFSQTSINDVHIAPRNVILEASSTNPHLAGGAGIIRSDVDLVTVPVTITDNFNRPVIGLDQDNFQLFENKKPQEIRHFSSEDTPVSIGLIVDMSGSMADKVERTKEAIRQFCEQANPQDEFFVITFADAPHLVADFTNRTEEVQNSLLAASPRGRTSLLDAVYMGLRKMHDARYSRRALLILSDGGDNHSRYDEHDVESAVKESDVLLYAVGTYDRYVNTQEEMLGPELLQSITEVTGGRAYTLTNIGDLPGVTRAIGVQLRHQYVLAYRPESRPQDGKWHKISVKLRLPKRLHALLRVDARPGYYAAAE
ncbi:MAG: VWA domain-containing protein [Candidatus Sulfotelmatobacter sp.]